MEDVEFWITLSVGLAALIVAVLTYLHRRGRSRLEYVVIVRRSLLPDRVSHELEVMHQGAMVSAPALTVLRLVSVGDQAIRPPDFETDLIMKFEGAHALASATVSARRPADLRPDLVIHGDCVHIAPTLINPGDMLELQVISAGEPSTVSAGGRVANLTVVQRDSLPYSPGSGSEGQMVGFDRFVWFVVMPGLIVAVALLVVLNDDVPIGRGLVIVAVAAVVLILYLLQVAGLVNERRRWRP
jgi:hypothetical protein